MNAFRTNGGKRRRFVNHRANLPVRLTISHHLNAHAAINAREEAVIELFYSSSFPNSLSFNFSVNTFFFLFLKTSRFHAQEQIGDGVWDAARTSVTHSGPLG